MPAEKILEAQNAVQAAVAHTSFADRRRFGFNPVIDGSFFPGGPFAPGAPAVSADVPLMIGSNKDEMTLFLGHQPWVTGATFETLPAAMEPYLGARAAEIVAAYRKAQPKLAADALGLTIVGDLGVRVMSLTLAERKMKLKAAPVFVYLFAWETPVLGGRLRSCHTLEIPFVFNNLHTAEITGKESARLPLGGRMARAWIAFAREGNPGWPAYSKTDRATMVFDTVSRVQNDPYAQNVGSGRRRHEDHRRFADAVRVGRYSAHAIRLSRQVRRLELTRSADPADRQGARGPCLPWFGVESGDDGRAGADHPSQAVPDGSRSR